MYNKNIAGNYHVINEIEHLMSKIEAVPQEHLSVYENLAIREYLLGIKEFVASQLEKPENKIPEKKLDYYFVDLDLHIYADNGRECEKIQKELGIPSYKGVIRLTNMVTGAVTEMFPIDIGEPIQK